MKDRLIVGVVQPDLRAPDETPMEATKRICKMMKDAADKTNFDLFVLPEVAPVGYSEDTFQKFLPSTEAKRKLFDEIDEEMAVTAKSCHSHLCYGTIGWKDEVGKETRYYIRQKVVDPSGKVVACYDKIYLCDYGDCNETRFFTPGKSLSTFDCQGWQFGLMVCADIRYPMLCNELASSACLEKHNGLSSRSSVLDTCQVILQPACFSRDLSFRTWKSFRETRAVENGVYFVATNYAGNYYGESSVTPPWVDEDHEPLEWDNEPGVYRAVLEKSAVQWAREEMPYYRHNIQNKLSFTEQKHGKP